MCMQRTKAAPFFKCFIVDGYSVKEFRASGMKVRNPARKKKLKKSHISPTFRKTTSALTQRADVYSEQLNH